MSKFRKFYQSHRERIFSYLMKRTGDYYLSGDIMQESFMRYFEKYGEGQTNPSLLNVITRNALVDGYRRPDRNPISFDEQEHCGMNPERHLMVRESYRRVLAAMQKLEKADRKLLMLVVNSGLTDREIARITSTSEGNVRVMVHRARMKLKKMIAAGEA